MEAVGRVRDARMLAAPAMVRGERKERPGAQDDIGKVTGVACVVRTAGFAARMVGVFRWSGRARVGVRKVVAWIGLRHREVVA